MAARPVRYVRRSDAATSPACRSGTTWSTTSSSDWRDSTRRCVAMLGWGRFPLALPGLCLGWAPCLLGRLPLPSFVSLAAAADTAAAAAAGCCCCPSGEKEGAFPLTPLLSRAAAAAAAAEERHLGGCGRQGPGDCPGPGWTGRDAGAHPTYAGARARGQGGRGGANGGGAEQQRRARDLGSDAVPAG